MVAKSKPGEGTSLTKEEKIAALKRTNLFSDLNQKELDSLSSILVMNHFPKGHRVFSEGSEGEHMYIVITGKVNITRDWGILNREMSITLNKGDFFGEMSILDNNSRCANATMAESGVLLSIDRNEFREIISRSPEFSFHIMSTLCKRLRKANDDLAKLALETI